MAIAEKRKNVINELNEKFEARESPFQLVDKEQEGKPTETDSIRFKISPKTPRGKKDSTKRHHHRHHKRQPAEQQFPIQVVTG